MMTESVQVDESWADVARALAGEGLLEAAASGPLMAARGSPLRVVWANNAARMIFGGVSDAALTRICLTGTDAGARQLSRLASTLKSGGENTLRLRLRLAGGFEMLTLSCRKTGGPDALFLMSPWGHAPAEAAPAEAGEPAATAPAGIEAKANDAPAPIIASSMPAIAAASSASKDHRGNARFLWRTDREGRISDITGAFSEAIGCDPANLIGRDFRELASELALDPDGKLRGALSKRDTWSGIEVLWPLTGQAKRAPVVLGALPGFDRERAFDGFSGFGVIHLNRLVDAPVEPEPVADGTEESGEASTLAQALADDADDSAAEPETFTSQLQEDEAEAAGAGGENTSGEDEIPEPHRSPADSGDLASAPTAATGGDDEEQAGSEDISGQDIRGQDIRSQDIRGFATVDERDALDREEPATTQALTSRIWVQPAGIAPLRTDEPGTATERETTSQARPDEKESIAANSNGDADPAETAGADAMPVAGEPTADPDVQDKPANAGPVAGNVVRIRAWQKESRGPLAVTETPNFTRPRGEDPTHAAPLPAPEQREPARTQSTPLHAVPDIEKTGRDELTALTQAERNAFREIARALGARGLQESLKQESLKQESLRQESGKQDAVTTTETLSRDNAGAEGVETEKPMATSLDAAPAFVVTRASEGTAVDRNLARLVERLDSGVLVSRHGIPVYVNKTLLDILGYADIDDFHRSGGIDRMFRGRSPDALSRDADGGAIPVVAGDGEVLALEGRFQTLEWDGEPATLMTFRRTQGPEFAARIRSLEHEVRRREADARETHAILDTATDGVIVLDEDGRILMLNKSAQALFGYDQNEVAGENFTTLLGRESHAHAMDYLNGLRTNGVKSLLNDGREVAGRARQGGAIPLFMTLGRVGAGAPSKFCAVLRDLTPWKKVERELSESRKEAERTSALKSDFLARVSHEIRTPLNAIIGFAEVITDERFGPIGNDRYKDYLKDIHASGTHVLSLVNDLLDLSKIEAGKMDMDFGAVNANRIVGECVSLIQTQAARERVIIRLSLAPRLPNIVADERALRQIVLNLLSNAVKFNEPGGQVIVSTALTDAGHAMIRVRDTGIGMNEKELEVALEPFRQVATSRKTSGTGLGLPLTKALVEANRATFTIKSVKGEGTLAEVSFPQTRVLAE